MFVGMSFWLCDRPGTSRPTRPTARTHGRSRGRPLVLAHPAPNPRPRLGSSAVRAGFRRRSTANALDRSVRNDEPLGAGVVRSVRWPRRRRPPGTPAEGDVRGHRPPASPASCRSRDSRHSRAGRLRTPHQAWAGVPGRPRPAVAMTAPRVVRRRAGRRRDLMAVRGQRRPGERVGEGRRGLVAVEDSRLRIVGLSAGWEIGRDGGPRVAPVGHRGRIEAGHAGGSAARRLAPDCCSSSSQVVSGITCRSDRRNPIRRHTATGEHPASQVTAMSLPHAYDGERPRRLRVPGSDSSRRRGH